MTEYETHHKHFFEEYNTTLLPSVDTTALGMFCSIKYTHHTFAPIIKHSSVTTTANVKYTSKTLFVNKYNEKSNFNQAVYMT